MFPSSRVKRPVKKEAISPAVRLPVNVANHLCQQRGDEYVKVGVTSHSATGLSALCGGNTATLSGQL